MYWCAADIGWVTGHSYIVYGPLCNGATSVLYEGTPDFPDKDRFWEIVERYKVTILYTAPTAIRTFMKWGTEYPRKHDLSSLRLLGTVGEPINPEAWMWYREYIGGGRCPVVDTWWQTETGAHHDLAAARRHDAQARQRDASRFPGLRPDIVNEQGESVPLGGGGYIVLTRPWPAMLRGIWGDDERYVQTYWSKFPHMYLAGDGCQRDEDGNYWFMGRIDDVMNVSGHRISTTEVESALVDHPDRRRSRGRGKHRRHDRSGDLRVRIAQGRATTARRSSPTSCASTSPRNSGKFTVPKYITFTQELPKTRSGKIMRRLLRDIAEGRIARRHDDARRFEPSSPSCRRAPRPKPAKKTSYSQPRSRAMRAASVRFSAPTLPIASLR